MSVSLDRLREQVERKFRVMPEGSIGWPDPHGDDLHPASEEYSRVSDPGRWMIVGARVRAWADALVCLGLAEASQEPTPPALQIRTAHTATTVRLRPTRASAVTLWLALWPLDGEADVAAADAVSLGVGEPARCAVEMLPDCSCDACDGGSAGLLASVDEAIEAVVAHPFVHVEGPGWTITTEGDGWSASGREAPSTPLIEETIARALAGEHLGTDADQGGPWFR